MYTIATGLSMLCTTLNNIYEEIWMRSGSPAEFNLVRSALLHRSSLHWQDQERRPLPPPTDVLWKTTMRAIAIHHDAAERAALLEKATVRSDAYSSPPSVYDVDGASVHGFRHQGNSLPSSSQRLKLQKTSSCLLSPS
jgi:hypothetical protein